MALAVERVAMEGGHIHEVLLRVILHHGIVLILGQLPEVVEVDVIHLRCYLAGLKHWVVDGNGGGHVLEHHCP